MKRENTKKIYLAGYIPVIHKGYIKLFKRFKDVDTFLVFDQDLIKSEDYLRKDIRALKPSEAVSLISSTNYFSNVELLNKQKIKILDRPSNKFVFPDDDISHSIAEAYINKAKVEYYPVFLRWDRRNIGNLDLPIPNETISKNKLDEDLMNIALDISTGSSDIWRRVGAVLVDRWGKVLDKSANTSEPSQYSPWIEGETRLLNKVGEGIDLTNFMHAEARLIARASKNGKSIKDLSMYVSTFPCPTCALLLSESGIKKIYYKDGYGVLNGADILAKAGVELIRVPVKDLKDKKGEWENYPVKPKINS